MIEHDVLCNPLSSTLICRVGACQYLFLGALCFHHSARNFAASEHDFLVKQNTMIGFFWEYFTTTSESLLEISNEKR